jgi:surface antigen
VLTSTACADLESIGRKEGAGTLGGAALGGFLGSQIGGGTGKLAATAAGTLIGALAGNSIGSSLDKADALYVEQTTATALDHRQVGKRVAWSNPETGHHGNVRTISQTHANGTVCREYQQTVVIGGRSQSAFGTACRQSDGSWKLTS